MRGQTLIAPNWESIFTHWQAGTNPLYEQLIPFVDSRLDQLIDNPVVCRKLKEADFALFISR